MSKVTTAELVYILHGQKIQGMNMQTTVPKKSSLYKPKPFLRTLMVLLKEMTANSKTGWYLYPNPQLQIIFSFKTCLNPPQT